jgi:endonuclease YncB( thermonuclease family)
MDVFGVDQYGRLLADVCGARVGQHSHILQRWMFAEECVAAGWAHTTPLYVQPHCVGQALEAARTNRIGAWGLQTDERPFQGKYKFNLFQLEIFEL